MCASWKPQKFPFISVAERFCWLSSVDAIFSPAVLEDSSMRGILGSFSSYQNRWLKTFYLSNSQHDLKTGVMCGVCCRFELSLGHLARMLRIPPWFHVVLSKEVFKETSSVEVSFFDALMVLWTWILLLMHWFRSVILSQIWQRRISKSQVRRYSR